MSERSKTAGNKVDVFTSLYNLSFEYVYGFVYARTGDAGKAEEIVQETYTAAWAELDRFKSMSSVNTWIIAIARRRIADWYRKSIRREQHEKPIPEPECLISDMSLDDIILKDMTREHISLAFAALNPVCRFVLAMKYLDGCSMREIAKAMRRTPKAVDGILQRAKAHFIKNYTEMTGGDGDDGR